jgi:hypothetical protein
VLSFQTRSFTMTYAEFLIRKGKRGAAAFVQVSDAFPYF